MPKGKQSKQEQVKTPEVVDKKIKKGKKAKANDEPAEQSASQPQSPIKKGKKQPQEKKPKATKDRFNKLYYPETPNQQFPNQLQENVINVIASYGTSAPLKDITNNLTLFYTNEVEEQAVHSFLAQAEESGIIYERSGQYHVANELIPPQPQPKQVVSQSIEQEPLPLQVNESAVKQPQDHEQIDFEDQIQNQQSEKKEVINENDENQNLFDN
ncbi:unnamed protein product (macronuclear) [Paramecium tetraurelia]|uniref:H15 domain-containing protein n=1 Tax=Paramecium tetraurelia TaxID=5888 RepID=A0BF31_PARTE|nr:uncharacterized protein GSPATT00028183001 [Paramecium tetraurelia]CAK57148.1 unnamed protein product [Paramecium tetraurelia]|eukprot:XP_001424546.1 hypothetical protein (macronuclear) [Paramecium tetraurelia strain d4-2]